MGFREAWESLVSKPTQSISSANIMTLADKRGNGKGIVIDPAMPMAKKTTPEIKRVDKASLEMAWLSEPTVFNTINKTTQIITSAGYKFQGDPDSVQFFNGFFDEIGSRGGDTEWEEILGLIFKHQMVYGDAWNELIPSAKDKSRIVDLDIVDPKKMDYAKGSDQKIVLDKFGDSVGYVENLPMDYNQDESGKIESPKEVSLGPGQIFLPPERVVHYKLHTIGDGFYGVGLIEPSFKTIIRKMSMEEALANAVNRTGFPTRKAKVGDLNHEPTEETIQRAVEQLKNMDYMGVLAFPYWIDVSMDEAKNPEKLQLQLDYYINQIVTGTGMPNALSTGAGEATNRSTLNIQMALAKLTLKDMVRRTTKVIEKRIIGPVAASNGVNPVKIQWGDMSTEELGDKAKRLVAYAQAGLIRADPKLEALIRNIEDLPELEISERAENPQ